MNNTYSFIGGAHGPWRVDGMQAVTGAGLDAVACLDVVNAPPAQLHNKGTWLLHGFTSNVRYAVRDEVNALKGIQQGLNRPASTCAALIPIKKTAAWWALAQDERRAIFEAQSHHTAIGLEYLPAIARQLHHCRDLGEPFDFLTWFEFAPQDTPAFNHMLVRLRASKEWTYVEREVDIRLSKRA
ncbi:MAG: chlorite dismutase family protein [Burkholderiales bacterium]